MSLIYDSAVIPAKAGTRYSNVGDGSPLSRGERVLDRIEPYPAASSPSSALRPRFTTSLFNAFT